MKKIIVLSLALFLQACAYTSTHNDRQFAYETGDVSKPTTSRIVTSEVEFRALSKSSKPKATTANNQAIEEAISKAEEARAKAEQARAAAETAIIKADEVDAKTNNMFKKAMQK